MNNDGISVIICCYNSSWVISNTLNYLYKQKNNSAVNWEIILVDNNSSDDTSKIVSKEIPFFKEKGINLKLLFEKTPGLSYARNKGINQASFEFLIFCDDDNFLHENYIETAYNIMKSSDAIAACGGQGIPLFMDVKKPDWFDRFKHCYATGKQRENNPNLLRLYGAGTIFRKRALEHLKKVGFKPLLTGRKGKKLLAGEDTELTIALRLLGYQLYDASDQLTFSHYLLSRRINIDYLADMHKGFGIAEAVLFFYHKSAELCCLELKGQTRIYNQSYLFFLLKASYKYLYFQNPKDISQKILYQYNKGILIGAVSLFTKSIQANIIIKRLIKESSKTAKEHLKD